MAEVDVAPTFGAELKVWDCRTERTRGKRRRKR
jgi:hypothetical protein